MTELTLNCLIVDFNSEPLGDVFEVRVPDNATVSRLLEDVVKKGGYLVDIPIRLLVVWRPHSFFPTSHDGLFEYVKNLHLNTEDRCPATQLKEADSLREHYLETPSYGRLHLIIQLSPPRDIVGQKRRREEAQGTPVAPLTKYMNTSPQPFFAETHLTSVPEARAATAPSSVAGTVEKYKSDDDSMAPQRKRPRRGVVNFYEKWRVKRQREEVPSIKELYDLVEMPLSDSEKIPISEEWFEALISYEPTNLCTGNDVDTLFTIGDSTRLSLIHLVNTALSSAPRGNTKSTFHHFWDSNIRKVLEALIPEGQSIRDSNYFTDTRNCRPDFVFLINGVCPFQGEEKGPDDPQSAKAELRDKIAWVYDPVPYMLGYYCHGTNMTLTAIAAPRIPGAKVELHDIVSVDLRLREHRIANIRHLINLLPLLPLLTRLVSSPTREFITLTRPNCTVRLNPTQVVKTYHCKDAEAKVKHIQKIYEILKNKSIPNTDALVGQKRKKSVVLGPRGTTEHPYTDKELWECLTCILHTLEAAHKVPLYHRDIRWSNVIRSKKDPSKWFLIDWEHATTPPTKAQTTFSEDNHSPDVFHDRHGSEVDIWGIGHLIRTCRSPNISTELSTLGLDICEQSQELGADAVLTLLNNTVHTPH